MISEDFTGFLAELMLLDAKQLEAVRKRVGLLLSNLPGAAAKVEEDFQDDWLLDGIIENLRQRAIRVPPYSVMVKSPSFAGFIEKSKFTRNYLERHILGMTKLEKRALGIVVIRSLISYLDWMDITLGVVLRNVGLIPTALERSYPGYVEAGMLFMLVRERREAAV